MMQASHVSHIHINLSDIVANYHYFAKINKNAAAVVKANCYGLGIKPIAQALHNNKCQKFYCFSLKEACQLRKILPINADIYFFAGVQSLKQAVQALKYKVIPVINRVNELQFWLNAGNYSGKQKKPLCVHFDSGMNRLGLSISDMDEFYQFYSQNINQFDTPMIMSHLACSDDPEHFKNQQQLAIIKQLHGQMPKAQLSLAATCGAMLGKEYQADEVRIGIGLYGVAPGYGQADLRNPLSWRSPIMRLRSLVSGETIGYGASVVECATRVAIVAGGYADGIRRSFAGCGVVYVGGVRCCVLGRVSMDCFAVDVGGVGSVCEGDYVELLGIHQDLFQLSESMCSVPYEVLCGIGVRVERKFID